MGEADVVRCLGHPKHDLFWWSCSCGAHSYVHEGVSACAVVYGLAVQHAQWHGWPSGQSVNVGHVGDPNDSPVPDGPILLLTPEGFTDGASLTGPDYMGRFGTPESVGIGPDLSVRHPLNQGEG